jgi:CRP-like cAMP-binding protein
MDIKPKNRILAAIPEREWTSFHQEVDEIELIRGDVLVEPGSLFTHVFFPERGIVSTVAAFDTGSFVETGTTGSEGMVSINAALGGATALHLKVVQVPGSAYRVKLETLARICGSVPTFRETVYAYAQAYLGQILQSVACSGVHSIEERCARWLLMCHDRSERDRFPLTQEFLAELLGASRPAVNRVCRILQSAGAIRYSHGMVAIQDRQGLTKASCECYAAIRQQFDQLLPGSFAREANTA